MRLVAVFGYSPRRPEGLHGICESRVRHAEHVVRDDDAVLLSGEADLMHGAWNGHQVLLDPHARNTPRERVGCCGGGGAGRSPGGRRGDVGLARVPREDARARCPGPGVEVTASPAPGRAPLPLLARELGCLAVLPLQLAAVRLSAPRRRASRSR